MKKLFLAAGAALALLASCNKETEMINPAPEARPDGASVTITLSSGDDAQTRAFFDATATAEAWEKSLSSLSVFTFNTSGELCSFYAVANYDASSAKTKSALTALVEKSAGDYNGTFADVSTQALRSGGFVMSGSTTKTVGAVNTSTQVGISLKRTVAKVALQTTIAPEFSEKYPGSITIHSVKLSRAASQSLVVAGEPSTGAMSYTHTQTPGTASSKYNSLFYLYETGTLDAGSRVLLEINATYDGDGSSSTSDDRSEVTYSVELTGKAAGQILRNGYYWVAANITGLVGQDCQVSVTVADWETPVTQSVDLGA